MTLVKLAKTSGLDDGNLSRIERGERKPPKPPRLLEILAALGIEKDSPEWHALLSAAARDRFETFGYGDATYLRQGGPLHGASTENGSHELSLTQAALEIGRICALYGVKKITVEANDGSEWFFPIREPEEGQGSH